MGRKINFSKYTDLQYLLNNYSTLNNYLEFMLNNGLEFYKNEILYLNEINSLLEKIEKSGINKVKSNLELILLKENHNEDYLSYICSLYQKDTITENDILLFSYLFNNKECEFIFRRLIRKAFNIFTFGKKTIEIIKKYISNDKWLDNTFKIIGRNKVEEILDEINISYKSEIDITPTLKDRFLELLNILSMTTLDAKTVKNIIITIKMYLSKIKENIGYENYKLYKEMIDILSKMKDVADADPINNITNKLLNNELNLELGKSFIQPLYFDDNLPLFKKKAPIITLDDSISPDLDSAFSIRKENDIYLFNVYVTDTPSFLGKNRELSINAYKQGTSFYIRAGNKNINYDMLPENLSHDYLSMLQCNKGARQKSAICFQFVFNNAGALEDCKVSRNKVIIDYNVFKKEALSILNQKRPLTSIDKSLHLLQELTKLVANTSTKKNFQPLKDGKIGDMIAFPSILINYYLAEQLEFGMFYEKGSYIKIPSATTPYLRAGAPLRRYADDINLALFLEQENLQHFNADDFRYLENNFDEVLEHLNEQNLLDKYIKNNNSLVKQYYLKKRD